MAAAVTAVAGRDEMAPVGAEKRIFRWQMKLMQKELKSVNSEEQVSLRHPVCLHVAVGCGSRKFLFHAFLSSGAGAERTHSLFSFSPYVGGRRPCAVPAVEGIAWHLASLQAAAAVGGAAAVSAVERPPSLLAWTFATADIFQKNSAHADGECRGSAPT